MKGWLGYNGNNTLIQAIDFSYHTVLQFHFGQFKEIRGYLDTSLSESLTGKSSTADTLKMYTDLVYLYLFAGNSATVPDLSVGVIKLRADIRQEQALSHKITEVLLYLRNLVNQMPTLYKNSRIFDHPMKLELPESPEL